MVKFVRFSDSHYDTDIKPPCSTCNTSTLNNPLSEVLQLQPRCYLCDISTAGTNFPRVSKVGGVHLQLVVAAHQIIVDIPIKVTTQAAHPALQPNACIRHRFLVKNTKKKLRFM